MRGGSMTIVALMSTTLPQAYLLLGFIYGRYPCENNKKLAVILMGSYLIAELVIIAQFLNFVWIIGLQMLFISPIAVVMFKFS